MFKVVEAFSGIGSQAKALKNVGIEHEIIATIDWDINAIVAYDIIHNGKPDLSICESINIDEIKNKLKKYTLSLDGKNPLTEDKINKLPINVVKHLWAAMHRENNLVSITDVKGNMLPNDIDLLTYSFPCQDLSIARAWHGENGGIDRNANNRSGMLWEVERILEERVESGFNLPKFLLMENVTNILSKTHKKNFNEWKNSLEKMGYYNHVYKLNASDFGVPQKRSRAYMISILCDDKDKKNKIRDYINSNDLSNNIYLENIIKDRIDLKDILKLDYNNMIYKIEADESNPNNTPSRQKIYNKNQLIYDGETILVNQISTITTKQDRHPNSGVIEYLEHKEGKSRYRNLTPRECFLLMGFEEDDFQALIDNNFKVRKNRNFFTTTTLHKMAGNSIVVKVLEYIFEQIRDINENIL